MFEVSERMAKISDPELQARILREAIGSSEKKRKLEEDIRIADGRSVVIDSAAKDECRDCLLRKDDCDNVNKQI